MDFEQIFTDIDIQDRIKASIAKGNGNEKDIDGRCFSITRWLCHGW